MEVFIFFLFSVVKITSVGRDKVDKTCWPQLMYAVCSSNPYDFRAISCSAVISFASLYTGGILFGIGYRA